MSTNPAEPSHWIAELIEKYTTLDNLYQDKTISVDNANKEYTEKLFFHHSTYRDNKFLPKSFVSDCFRTVSFQKVVKPRIKTLLW